LSPLAERTCFSQVSNAGGIGVIGGLGYTKEMLREQCRLGRQKAHTDTEIEGAGGSLEPPSASSYVPHTVCI
jgi:NAD(P)H-dependent flavin oxidoreductase YrpB (nitropropane dioxygenase family)